MAPHQTNVVCTLPGHTTLTVMQLYASYTHLYIHTHTHTCSHNSIIVHPSSDCELPHLQTLPCFPPSEWCDQIQLGMHAWVANDTPVYAYHFSRVTACMRPTIASIHRTCTFKAYTVTSRLHGLLSPKRELQQDHTRNWMQIKSLYGTGSWGITWKIRDHCFLYGHTTTMMYACFVSLQ